MLIAGNSKRYIPFVAVLLLMSILISSCKFYRDTTTYFNVYYDAQRHITLYEEKLGESQATESGAIAAVTSHRWLDEEYESRRALRLRGTVPPPVKLFYKSTEITSRSGDVKHLDSAIILGSKILADKNPTKFVEGALFLTGKALYYKNDYSGARRKFNELLFKYPSTEFAPEVGRLLTKTLIVTHQYDTATTVILASISRLQSLGETEEVADAQKMYAEVILMRGSENIALAAEQLELAEANLDKEEAARIAYERGALRYIEGNWAEAEKAFAKTIANSPDNFAVGEAMIGHALALRRLGKYQEARQELEGVISKVRYSASHPAANFELAVVVEEEARSLSKGRMRDVHFTQQLYPPVRQAYFVLDTSYRNVSQAIMARSRFRQAELFRAMGEYDSAARIANILIGTKDFSSQEINDFVNERMRALQRFAQQKTVLERTEKLERLIARSRESGTNILATIAREIKTLAERQVLGARWRPDGPNTFTADEEKQVVEAEARIKKEREAAGEPLSILRIADTNRFVDSVKFISAKAHYELARGYDIFGEQMNASLEYAAVLDKQYFKVDTVKTNLNARTLFSWVELEHQRRNYPTRDSLISILTTNYGESQYASAASRLYTGIGGEESSGEKAYKVVIENIKVYGFEVQKPKLLEISNIFNHEDVAPRALYAIGVNFEELSRYDSAVYYYKRVVSEYPFSRYAEVARPRLSFSSLPKDSRSIVVPDADSPTPPVQEVNTTTIVPPFDTENKIMEVSVDPNAMGGIGMSPRTPPPVKKEPKK
jgi:TolA-binding protein